MSELDLLSIGSGGKVSGAVAAQASPDASAQTAGDPLIWTVLGEAGGNPEGQRAVASTIVNRARKLGAPPVDVVNDETQGYEAWTPKKRAELQKQYPVGSDAYNQAQATVGEIFAGKAAPPYGYDTFYSPVAQKALGRPAPTWDDGTGVDVGGNLFFAGKYAPAEPDLTKIAKRVAPPSDAAMTTFDASGNLKAGDTGEPFTPAQNATYQTLYKGGRIAAEGKPGTADRPWMQRRPEDAFAPGDYFIAVNGDLRRMPGGEAAPGGGVKGGFGQGVEDVPNSLIRHLPGIDESAWGTGMEANRLLFNAAHGNDVGAQFGRLGGEIVGSALPMMSGDLALGALGAGVKGAVPAAAPVADFLAGKAGTTFLTRLPSVAARSAIEGAATAGLTSAGSDAPLGQQLKTGAMIGGVLGPVGLAGKGVINRLFNPAISQGVPAAEQQLIYKAAQGLPVPVPLTQGQISAAPKLQMTENALMRGARGDAAAQVMREHAASTQGALRSNVDAITGQMTGGVPLQAGEGGAMVSNRLNTAYDAANKGVNDAYTTARAAADGAYLPAAERGKMTQQIREGLRDFDISGVPRVKSILDGLDQSPTSSTFTPTDIFDARAKLSTLRGSNESVESAAAGRAVKALDGYIDDAVTHDLISGDPAVVKAWRDAISKRRDFGKLFEGNDLIQSLTERALHGEGRTMKVSPEDASNLIFGRADLGFVGKQDLTRDLTRLRGVLGADSPEWGALRSEAFMRIARAGEGAPEGGAPQFSGQKFYKAWETAKAKNPQIVQTLFTADERKLIDQFAEVAQRATTPIKGGDNPSNSGVYVETMARKALENLGAVGGGATGSVVGGAPGAAVGVGAGRVFDTFMRDIGAVVKARKLTSGAAPVSEIGQPKNRLLGRLVIPTVVTTGNKLLPAPASP